MDGLALAGLALQLATLVAVLVLAWSLRARRPSDGRSALPPFVDGPLSEGEGPLPGGTWHIRGGVECGGSVLASGAMSLEVRSETVQVYEVWVRCDHGWVQLQPGPHAPGRVWRNLLLAGVRLSTIRLWIAPLGPDVDDTALRQSSGLLTSAALVLARSRNTPVTSMRTPRRAPPRADEGLDRLGQDPATRDAFARWDRALDLAARTGWTPALLRSDTFVPTLRAEGVSGGEAIARWLLARIGKATRVDLKDRDHVAMREPALRRLYESASDIVGAVAPSLVVEVRPPAGVGEAERHEWLVDDEIAHRLRNLAIQGVLHPVVVLRPLLRRGEVVLVEGEVA